jgi:hypothetical protein
LQLKKASPSSYWFKKWLQMSRWVSVVYHELFWHPHCTNYGSEVWWMISQAELWLIYIWFYTFIVTFLLLRSSVRPCSVFPLVTDVDKCPDCSSLTHVQQFFNMSFHWCMLHCMAEHYHLAVLIVFYEFPHLSHLQSTKI